MESRHCGQDKRIFFCPVHNASTPCSLQAFGVRCIVNIMSNNTNIMLNSNNSISNNENNNNNNDFKI